MLTLTAPCSEHQGSWRHRAAGLWVGRPQGSEPLRACSPSASTPTTGHNLVLVFASGQVRARTLLHRVELYMYLVLQLQPHRASRGCCTQLIFLQFAVRRCSMTGGRLGQVRQPAPAGPWMAASCATSAPTSAGANSPSALSTARNSGLISRPTPRTCCRSPGSTPGLLWAANHTCLCAGSLLQVAESRCGGVGGKRR